jgi:predicted TIM-barrel fold metal-dependent hydrolase
MVIDAHGHIGHWETGEITPEYVIQLMDEAGISLSIISNLEGVGRATNQSQPNERTLQVVRKYPRRFRGLVWINPWGGEISLRNTRECLQAGSEFVGMKFHPYHNAFHFNSPEVRPFVHLALEFDVPLAVHTAYDEYSHPHEVIELASQNEYTKAKFILYHAGLGPPDLHASQVVFEQVARHANLYVDNSWFNKERLALALKIIPLERILFGTDVPLGGRDHYHEYIEQLQSLDLSKEQRIKLTEANSRNLFKRIQRTI